jgi:hypothetical protein
MHLVTSNATQDLAAARLKAIFGASKASSRSPFVDKACDDIHLSIADFRHHTTHFKLRVAAPAAARNAVGSGVTMTASPVETVLMGEEPMAYLDKFGVDSFWYGQIQRFKQDLAIQAA